MIIPGQEPTWYAEPGTGTGTGSLGHYNVGRALSIPVPVTLQVYEIYEGNEGS